MAPNIISGFIAGYDPGGNSGHGLALASIENGNCTGLELETLQNVEEVICRIEALDSLLAIGVDTLVRWGTGPSGWRGADLWLRTKYPAVRSSIVSPNGLYGSMGINGMVVLKAVRSLFLDVHISEAHPKVLFWAMTGRKYNYAMDSDRMDESLTAWLGSPVRTRNEHEWDAAAAALSAFRGLDKSWTHNLFAEKLPQAGRLVSPVESAEYWWPE